MLPIIKLNIDEVKKLVLKNLGGGKIADYPQEKVFKTVREVCYKKAKRSLFVEAIKEQKVLIQQTKEAFEKSEKIFGQLLSTWTEIQTSKQKVATLKELKPKDQIILAAGLEFRDSYQVIASEKKQITADRQLAFKSTKDKISKSKDIILQYQDYLNHIEAVIKQIDTDWKILFKDIVYDQTERYFKLQVTRTLDNFKTVANLDYKYNFQKNKAGHWVFMNNETEKILRESFIDNFIVKHKSTYNEKEGFLSIDSKFTLEMDELDLTHKTTKGSTHVFGTVETEEWEEENKESFKVMQEFMHKYKNNTKTKSERKQSKHKWNLNFGLGGAFKTKIDASFEANFQNKFTAEYANALTISQAFIREISILHDTVLDINKKEIITSVQTPPKKSEDPRWVKILRKINKIKNILNILPIPKKMKYLRRVINILPIGRINTLLNVNSTVLKIYDEFFKKKDKTPQTITTTKTQLTEQLTKLHNDWTLALSEINSKSVEFKTKLTTEVKAFVMAELNLAVDASGVIAAKVGAGKGTLKVSKVADMNLTIEDKDLEKAQENYERIVNEYEEKITTKKSTQTSSKIKETTEKDVIVKGDFELKLLCYTNKEGKLDIRFNQNDINLIKTGLIHSPNLRFDFVFEEHISGVSN